MKTKVLKTSFRFFSFLAEKTGGWRIFVQPKLWLGAMIVGTITSCNSTSRQATMCYEPAVDDYPQVTCYEPVTPEPPTCYIPIAPDTIMADTTSTNKK